MKRREELIRKSIEFEHQERVRQAMERYEREKGLKFYTEEDFNKRIEDLKPTCEQLTIF